MVDLRWAYDFFGRSLWYPYVYRANLVIMYTKRVNSTYGVKGNVIINYKFIDRR